MLDRSRISGSPGGSHLRSSRLWHLARPQVMLGRAIGGIRRTRLRRLRTQTAMRIAYGVALVFSTAALVLALPAPSASHLAMPESALFHDGEIYVSLIGDPENNDGAVVTVDTRGKVTGTLAHAMGNATGRPNGYGGYGFDALGERWNADPQLQPEDRHPRTRHHYSAKPCSSTTLPSTAAGTCGRAIANCAASAA